MWRSLLVGGAIAIASGRALAASETAYATPHPESSSALNSSDRISAEARSLAGSTGVAYGLDLGSGFKAELEGLTQRDSNARFAQFPASGSRTTGSMMLHGLYEFRDGGLKMKPYVGAGFGTIDITERIAGLRGNDWVAAYQLRTGVSMGFSQKLLGSLEYRWTKGSKPFFSLGGIPTKLEVDRHGFVLGFNYKY